MTWQVKGGDPEQHKGYHASIAVREGGSLEEAHGHQERNPCTRKVGWYPQFDQSDHYRDEIPLVLTPSRAGNLLALPAFAQQKDAP